MFDFRIYLVLLYLIFSYKYLDFFILGFINIFLNILVRDGIIKEFLLVLMLMKFVLRGNVFFRGFGIFVNLIVI